MATSGTYTFTLAIDEIIEEAYEQAGLELRGGYDLSTARRSLNLLLTEWVNEGINLWTMDQLTTTLTDGSASYTLGARYIDLLDAVVRDADDLDTMATRISLSEYLGRTDKTQEAAKPVHWALERNALAGHTLYVWPTPDNSTHSFIAWAVRHIQDIGVYTNDAEVPRRFLPALVAGLAWHLAIKNPAKVPMEHRKDLEARYASMFEKARLEDRERTSFHVVPKIGRI